MTYFKPLVTKVGAMALVTAVTFVAGWELSLPNLEIACLEVLVLIAVVRWVWTS